MDLLSCLGGEKKPTGPHGARFHHRLQPAMRCERHGAASRGGEECGEALDALWRQPGDAEQRLKALEGSHDCRVGGAGPWSSSRAARRGGSHAAREPD